ncbi:MAG: 50S ribosomal protein L23 [Candidatus Micrarchaeota archaeon]|nr:50S ribosomal protein L23 [Candidatus Micrarchaeota archaeon]
MILLAPIKTEKAIGKIEFENTLTFEISMNANKAEVKHEVEKLFAVKVVHVKTFITAKGVKRALVKLAAGSKAEDVTTKLKMA